jgi:glycosyltransferase involved in cell wall biosynthesis
VEVLANVPSVLEVFHSADVAVFPDEHGVGIRNSVREALAAGLPVVATPVAAREQEAHPLLTVEADDEQFVRRVVQVLTGPRLEAAPQTEGVLRTWQTVANEYLDELRNATRSAGASPKPDVHPS